MLQLLRYAKYIVPLLLAGALFIGGYALGVKHTEAEYNEQLLEARAYQDKLITKLDAAARKITKRKTADVKTIYVEKDPTGCADTAVPDGMLEAIIGGEPSFD